VVLTIFFPVIDDFWASAWISAVGRLFCGDSLKQKVNLFFPSTQAHVEKSLANPTNLIFSGLFVLIEAVWSFPG